MYTHKQGNLKLLKVWIARAFVVPHLSHTHCLWALRSKVLLFEFSLTGVLNLSTESQSDWGRKGSLGPSGPTSVPAGTPRAGCPAPHPGAFWRSPRRLHSPCTVCARCLLSWHWLPPTRTWIHFICTLFRYFWILMRCPCASSSPGWAVPALSSSPQQRWTFLLLFSGLSPVCAGLSYCRAQNWIHCSRWGLTTAEQKGGITSFDCWQHSSHSSGCYQPSFYHFYFWYVADSGCSIWHFKLENTCFKLLPLHKYTVGFFFYDGLSSHLPTDLSLNLCSVNKFWFKFTWPHLPLLSFQKSDVINS